jgi:hypothetical protein
MQTKKRGRPSSFKPEFIEQAAKLCRLGATDKEMADFFGVAESTFHKWKIDRPEFSESIKSGKVLSDAEVANSLYLRAVGLNGLTVQFLPALDNYHSRFHVITGHQTNSFIFWQDKARLRPPVTVRKIGGKFR